jgi:opacity protein-like surface antigen
VRRAALALGLLATLSCAAQAADKFFAYNETTSSTFTGVYLAPAGTKEWGANQALNDKDKTLEPSERLALKGLKHARYDVRLVDEKGRTCVKPGIDLGHESTFVIREEDLQGCQ